MLNKAIKFFLYNPLVTVLLLAGLILWGCMTAPFGWNLGNLPTDPVPVDAIPDIGENQQIVYTEWTGRSPQDIEDQISYPLTSYLLGLPGVKSIRSSSMFGFSSIYVIFDESVEFYWSRSRILEKLSSLPAGLLPADVTPTLGPDATALGQVFWYTLEGRDSLGNPIGGWDLHELRSVQDFYVRYALNSARGVSEVASVGGFIREYQVEVDPDALKAYSVSLEDVMKAVRNSNRDVGAKTIEINQAEYLVRGLGYIKGTEDLRQAVVGLRENVPIRISDIGRVTVGPAPRRGILDKDGAEVVGGVVVTRYGANPLEVIGHVKYKIREIAPGLPAKTLADGTQSQLTIVPFYDRSILIHETLGTLEEALSLEMIITILVVIVMVFHLRASLLISSLLPIAVLMVFIAMRYFHVDANIVALSGIAIAIGTMVDLGIILTENVLRKMDELPKDLPSNNRWYRIRDAVYNGAAEVSSAILTAVSTTIISFIPVFTLQEAEGKLFRPLAFTKTFALAAALIVALFILPVIAHWVLGLRPKKAWTARVLYSILLLTGLAILFTGNIWGGLVLLAFGLAGLFRPFFNTIQYQWIVTSITVLAVTWLLTILWLPLGAGHSTVVNFLFVVLMIGLILGIFLFLQRYYTRILGWCLENKKSFLVLPLLSILLGIMIWVGFTPIFGFVAQGFDAVSYNIRNTRGWSTMDRSFPGIGEEFMPALDEGSFLLMPSSMPHSGVSYNRRILGQLDMRVSQIPEVQQVVGKAGRAETALDPAPVSMFENIITYFPEYITAENGRRLRFKTDRYGNYILQGENEERISHDVTWYYNGEDTLSLDRESLKNTYPHLRQRLVPDNNGEYFRNWRPDIRTPDDIWAEIVRLTNLPGITSSSRLQPIETRLVMLQTGMRAPMGIKVYGQDLSAIQEFGLRLEGILKEVPSVKKEAVFADRIVGKPYMQLEINRKAIARYGLSIEDVQQTIETAIGGMSITNTIEGRERYPVRVRYPRELRDSPESLKDILVHTPTGAQIPLGQLTEVTYVKGPQAIKSEDTFLLGYVLFDKVRGNAEVDVVEDARTAIEAKINSGELIIPAGISYKFSGSYENQVRSEKRLSVIVPIVCMLIFLILYFQFRSVATSLMVFSGVAMAFSGGFILLWLYGQEWFFNFPLFGQPVRELFQMHTINLSVAVWVGFIALFGIATDDGVLIATYLDQQFRRSSPGTTHEIRQAVITAGLRRVRPALMTVATTLIALLPVLTSTGRGADIMIPMAIPVFGGMMFALVSILIVPVIYCWKMERTHARLSYKSKLSGK